MSIAFSIKILSFIATLTIQPQAETYFILYPAAIKLKFQDKKFFSEYNIVLADI